MKSKTQKKVELKKLREKLPKSSITIFTTFSRVGEKGLSVAQMQELKRLMRSLNSEYTTAKKTLLEIALKNNKYDGIDIYGFPGSMGLVLSKEDPYAITKKLYEFAKKNQALQFFGALLDGQFLDKAKITEMALMPSREVLLARFLGMLMYPLTSLTIVLSEISKKKN